MTWQRDLGKRLDAGQDVARSWSSARTSWRQPRRAPTVTPGRTCKRTRSSSATRRHWTRRATSPSARSWRPRWTRQRTGATRHVRPLSRRRRPAARPLLHLVRALPALGLGRSEAPRHVRATSIERLPYVAGMGFDVLYLPPIHPIGRTHRKGANNATTPQPGDPGSPVGDRRRRGRPQRDPPRARHARRLPRRWSSAAGSTASRSRSTSPSSARPTTPGSTEHPDWFRHRPDGTIQYAENPPKKYQDIYPFDFETRGTGASCGTALLDVVRFWIDAGRPDLPGRQPAHQAVPVLGVADRRGQARPTPRSIFLAEAFTRPKVMLPPGQARLHPVATPTSPGARPSGSSPSTSPSSPRTPVGEFFRPNFWPNTPDILTSSCSTAAARRSSLRLVLAATLAADYGIYGPAFELGEHVAARAGQRGVPRLGEVPAPPLGPRRAATAFAPLIAPVNRDPAREPGPAAQRRRCASTPIDNDAAARVHQAQPRTASDARRLPSSTSTRTTRRRAGSTLPLDRARHRRRRDATRSHDLLGGATLPVARRRATTSSSTRTSAGARLRHPAAAPRDDFDDYHDRDRRAPDRRSRQPATPATRRAGDPAWYKDAIIYELHVRAFCDSERRRHRRLHGPDREARLPRRTSASPRIWLLPFYPSPLRDDGYDIADYRDVHPSYGTLRDFRPFLREAHARGLRVITELVLQPHLGPAPVVPARPARAAGQRAARDFYVWSDTPDRYHDARIIFKDFETSNWTWDPVADAYFWHRFYSPPARPQLRQPRGPRRDHARPSTSGCEMGVDGLRLDAVPYLFEREGTNCENLPETHDFLRELRAPRRRRASATGCCSPRPTSGPRTRSPTSANGDECHMAFHFPLMPRLFMAIRMEDRFPIIDILAQTPAIPDTRQWAHVPAQPRRADARDGDRRGARLHVPRLRRRPAGAHQPRHPPPARAAARQRPAPDRADERAAVLAARHAGPLLRRRDRHGRQRLPRRPQRRAHADAVERRPQRRLLARQPRSGSTCRSSSTPSTTTRRSTSRRSSATRTRCCGGCAG